MCSSDLADIFVSLDGTYASASKFVAEEENDWGNGFVGGVLPSWERRRTFNGCYLFKSIAAGEHTIEMMGRADSQAFFLRNLSFTIEQHYI